MSRYARGQGPRYQKRRQCLNKPHLLSMKYVRSLDRCASYRSSCCTKYIRMYSAVVVCVRVLCRPSNEIYSDLTHTTHPHETDIVRSIRRKNRYLHTIWSMTHTSLMQKRTHLYTSCRLLILLWNCSVLSRFTMFYKQYKCNIRVIPTHPPKKRTASRARVR